MASTWRATQKESRRADLLRAAAHLFARRGFAAVSTVELGEAVGMSGPALYKHFASKEALLAALLLDASRRLLEGHDDIVADGGDPRELLTRLTAFHIEFATTDPDIIRIQDRELPQLPTAANHEVRMLQRRYVQGWDAVYVRLRPDLSADERQTRLLAVFGLLNSTPHSVPSSRPRAAADVLAGMAERALLGDAPTP